MKRNGQLIAGLAATLFLAACSHGGGGVNTDASGYAAGIKQLQSYDANKDGNVTKAEMEAGLRASFDALDKDHSGTLTADEVHAENERRYKEDGPQYSPLLDWNQDGVIDFNEYASTTRSLFEQLDTNHDGVLTPDEMKAPRGPQLQEKPQRGGGRHGASFHSGGFHDGGY